MDITDFYGYYGFYNGYYGFFLDQRIFIMDITDIFMDKRIFIMDIDFMDTRIFYKGY